MSTPIPVPPPRPKAVIEAESARRGEKDEKATKPKPPSYDDVEREAAEARAALEQNLAALSVKLDVPAQTKKLLGRSVASYRRNPTPWLAAGAAAALAAAGLITWAVRRR